MQRLETRFHFRHADRLVHILEIFKDRAFRTDGNILKQSNPLMVMVLLQDLLIKIRRTFKSLSLRIDFVEE